MLVSVHCWEVSEILLLSVGFEQPSFKASLAAAVELYQARKNSRAELLTDVREKMKQETGSVFSRLKANRYLCPRPPKLEIPECGCEVDENGESCGEDCINRMLYVECDPKVCKGGKKCRNQRLAKRMHPHKLHEFKTEGRGWGLKCEVDLEPGDFVVEYVGEVMEQSECFKRLEKQDKAGTESFYMLSLDNGLIIDARLKANMARFANHSCDPNCITQKWNVHGYIRVGIFAHKHIPAGEVLNKLGSSVASKARVCDRMLYPCQF